MGGIGSGNWYRWDKKTTTEECHSVGVRFLYKNELLKPDNSFSLRWSRGEREMASIRGMVCRGRLILVYRHCPPGDEWENVVEPIKLTYTPCNFGGERPWFVCPEVINGVKCSRRVAVLYGPGKYFL
jgi:hypothetical protein